MFSFPPPQKTSPRGFCVKISPGEVLKKEGGVDVGTPSGASSDVSHVIPLSTRLNPGKTSHPILDPALGTGPRRLARITEYKRIQRPELDLD